MFRGMIYGIVGWRGSSSSRVVGPSPAPAFSPCEHLFFSSTFPTADQSRRKHPEPQVAVGSSQNTRIIKGSSQNTRIIEGSSQNTENIEGSSQNTGIRGDPAPLEPGFPDPEASFTSDITQTSSSSLRTSELQLLKKTWDCWRAQECSSITTVT